MVDMDNLGRRIRRLRESKGLSQEELAREIGITTSTISRWERGIGKPSRMALRSVKAYLEGQQWGIRRVFYGEDLT